MTRPPGCRTRTAARMWYLEPSCMLLVACAAAAGLAHIERHLLRRGLGDKGDRQRTKVREDATAGRDGVCCGWRRDSDQHSPSRSYRHADLDENHPRPPGETLPSVSGVGQASGTLTASHFARAALTSIGRSWAIQWPENITISVRSAQSRRIGSARWESIVSQV
jgi:hypothetical protein